MHYPETLSWVNVQNPADIKDAKTAKIVRSHAQREVRRREKLSKSIRLARKRKSSGPLHQDRVIGRLNNEGASDEESAKVIIIISLKLIVREGLFLPWQDCEEPDIPPTNTEIPHDSMSVALYGSSRFAKAPHLHQMIYRHISICMLYEISCSVAQHGLPSFLLLLPCNPNKKLTYSGYGEQATLVYGGTLDDRWKSWIPTMATEEAILYAQAFYATMRPQVWSCQSNTTDALALKHQAILHINRELSDSTAAVSMASLAAVLTLAFAAHIEVSCFILIYCPPISTKGCSSLS